MTKREIIQDKLNRRHLIWRFCKGDLFSYQLAKDGQTVYKTLHNNKGEQMVNKIDLESALKQLTADISDIMY